MINKQIDRQTMIQKMIELAPILTTVTCSQDMGYEFTAIVPDGVIYSYPGMMISYSEGQWPPDDWEVEIGGKFDELLKEMLLSTDWDVTHWSELSDQEIEEWFGDAEKSNCRFDRL